jgi:hypothetical protein
MQVCSGLRRFSNPPQHPGTERRTVRCR